MNRKVLSSPVHDAVDGYFILIFYQFNERTLIDEMMILERRPVENHVVV